MTVIVEEYLSVLGFRLDQASWSKFTSGIDRGVKQAASLGTSVVAAATAVQGAVIKIAQQYEDLYYVSQRTGSTVGNFKAASFGMQQVGVSFEQSRAAIEAFGQTIRTNPGLSSLLKNMGINPADASKALPAYVGQLKARFGEKGYFAAAAQAQMFGMDEPTFRMLWTNYDELQQKTAEYDKRLKEAGIDTDALAKKSKDFDNATEGLLSSLKLIADQTANRWLPLMTDAAKGADTLTVGFLRAGKDTDGWTSSILSLVAAMGGLKLAALALSFIPGMGGIAAALGGLAGGAVSTTLLAPAAIVGGAVAAGYAASKTPEGQAYKVTGDFGRDVRGMGEAIRPTLRRWFGIGEVGKRDDVIDYFMKQGWSREQATGLAANFHAESKFQTVATGDGGRAVGIGQWHPDRQAKFKELTGKDLHAASLEEQMWFANWELNNTEAAAGRRLRAARTAAEAGQAVSQYYERPKNVAGEALARGNLAQSWFDSAGPMTGPNGAGGTNVAINQKTEIKVEAGPDAQSTARAVIDGQERVNGDIVRNTRSAVR